VSYFNGGREHLLFWMLKLNRKNPTAARDLAEQLRQSPLGVALACRDVDVFGGHTRGWSSWIIENTKHSDVALREIALIAENGGPAQALEAVWLSWRMTHDSSYALKLFNGVSRRSDRARIDLGRMRLASVFESQPDVAVRLRVPASQPLGISESEFVERLERELLSGIRTTTSGSSTADDVVTEDR
jgi:hypothetical protein